MKAYSGRREALFNKTLSDGSAVSTGFQEYVDSLLPELYTSEDSLFHRMMAAVSSSHAITDIIEEDDPTMRTMKILHFLCEQNAAFFALAVLFDLQYPVDSGQCAAVTTEEECIAQMTFFDDNQRTCEWDPVYQECLFIAPEMRVEALIVITILLSLVWLPFGFATDMVFQNILLAPTAQEMDTLNVIENVKTVGSVFNAKQTEASRQQAAEAGISLTKKLVEDRRETTKIGRSSNSPR